MKEGWEIKKLGEVCEIRSGRDYKSIISEDGIYPILGSAGKPMGYTNEYICEEETTIIGRKGTINSPIFIETKFWNVDTAFGLHALEQLYSRFLFFFCLNFNFEELDKGSGRPSLVKKDLLQIPIPLPPLPEQQRIVALLDKAFASIEQSRKNAEQNLINAKEVFDSYLQEVFDGKSQGKYSNQLDELCELIVDCEHKTAPIQEEGYPSIRTPNIGKGHLILENVNRVSYETYIKWTKRAIPQGGDLILAREAPAGNIAVIPDNLKVCLGQRTVLIRPKKDKIISKYLAFLILSKDVQKQLLSHSVGATVEHINMKDIRAFKIFNLLGIEKQKEIVKNIEAVQAETQKLEAIYQKKLDNLDELKKSILQKPFNGEL